jgi:hypothetical protein
VESQPNVSVPNVGDNILNFLLHILSKMVILKLSLSEDDINRNKFYLDNQKE